MPPASYDGLFTGLPRPIPALWAARNEVHRRGSVAITLAQRAHMGFRDVVVVPLLEIAGVPEERIDGFVSRHNRFFDRVYDGLRAFHWYI